MKHNQLSAPKGANRSRTRVGRGHGSGHVKTAGRGQKGQKSRTGGNIRVGFEGGQNPLILRMPYKRGFKNRFKTEYQIVNVSQLADVDSSVTITPEWLLEHGFVDRKASSTKEFKVKLLGDGEVNAPLNVRVHKVTSGARSKIESAGGSVEEIDAAVTG